MYSVIASDGKTYGPVDIATLRTWCSEGRVTPETQIIDSASGNMMKAAELADLADVLPKPGPPAPPPVSYGPQGGPPPGYAGVSGPYSQPPGPYLKPGQPYIADDGSGDITKAYVLGAIGFLCCPIVFSSLAIYYAIAANRKGNPKAQVALIFAIASLVVGIIFGVIVGLLRVGAHP